MALVQIPSTSGFTGLNAGTNFVATTQTTTSTTYGNLTTAQTVTLTTGTKVLVILSAAVKNSAQDGWGFVSVAVSGATTRSSSDEDGKFVSGTGNIASYTPTVETTHVYLTCNAGSNTFTMQFKSDGGTTTFANRRITVIDLGS
jgi:hypothetical protein